MKEKTKIFQGIIEVDCPHWQSDILILQCVFMYYSTCNIDGINQDFHMKQKEQINKIKM